MGWFTQDHSDDTHTSVKAGYSRDHDVAATDIIIADRDGSGHQHVVIDDSGNEIHNERVEGLNIRAEMNIHQVRDVEGLVRYWRGCLGFLDQEDEKRVAGYMANVTAMEAFHIAYAEGSGDPDIVQLFDLVADLETPIEREMPRDEAWRQVGALLDRLERRYR